MIHVSPPEAVLQANQERVYVIFKYSGLPYPAKPSSPTWRRSPSARKAGQIMHWASNL